MKIVLAGSPNIAIKAFENIINNFDVVAIITQPDRPQGRGMKIQETAVSKLARKYNIKIFKPEKIISIKNELQSLDYDILLTFAFGQYIPSSILAQGKYKPINIHGSLLPKYRGAAPIHHAILNGDSKIGITLIEMTKEMDAGNIFFSAFKKIDSKTTTSIGFEIISDLAADNIVDWLKLIQSKEVNSYPQPDNFSLSPKIKKSFAELKFNLTKEKAIRKIRGLNDFPGAYIFVNNKRLKVFDVIQVENKDAIELEFIDGKLFAIDYQWEGKKRKK